MPFVSVHDTDLCSYHWLPGNSSLSWVGLIVHAFISLLYLRLHSCIFGYKILMRSKRVRSHEADFYSGKEEIDREEEAFLAHQAATKHHKKGGWVYRTFIAWLF